MSKAHLLLIFFWAVYFFIHSGLAAISVKNWVRKKMPKAFIYYRLFYNIISVLGLILLLAYSSLIPAWHIFPPSPIVKFTGLVLASWGVIIMRLAFKHYSTSEFLGINYQLPDPTQKQKLVVKGPSRYVRHPLYSATILLVVGFWLFAPTLTHLISLLCILIYLFIGIWLEEKKLIAEYGEEYEVYRKKVPPLIPRIRL